eukprot:TRINITY_DN36530_c0_g1_i1.p1 TRINITY_DN36530_c0_g1~~TRINITY_DN36530_c0_g1_i1.p1  ORF type:complete len:585 (+),score=59.11 TRINITY_DN36530_c0_g1_i1:51-1757(+)
MSALRRKAGMSTLRTCWKLVCPFLIWRFVWPSAHSRHHLAKSFVAFSPPSCYTKRISANKKSILHSQPDDIIEATVVTESAAGANDNDVDDATLMEVMEASQAGNLFYLDVVLVGSGAAGVGVAHALLRGGLDPSKILIVDKGPSVGSSFRQWHETTRFISPSWPGYPFGIQDLNAVVPDTAVNGRGEHPTGDEYASYLERMVKGSNLAFMFNNTVTSIERQNKQDCFVIKTDLGAVIIANYVVWCGGEWVSPRMLNIDAFPKDATVHYKHANVDELLQSLRGVDDQIVLVGGGEAGADLGVALANRGARVLIVESSSDEDSEEGEALDPSRRLSPVTQERLSMAGDKIEFRSATKCIGCRREGDTVTVNLEAADQAVTTVTTGSNVVLCTGFDPSCNPILKDLFSWKDGSPEVTPTHDESKITRNLFLAGPGLLHTLSCAPGDDKEESNAADNADNSGDTPNETQNIIFCFVYKYRTRFAVVASEIIKRFVEYQMDNMDDEHESTLSTDELYEILAKCEKMQSYYRSKGMMLTDLSCAQLACGMKADDAPVYDYDPCRRCESDCLSC